MALCSCHQYAAPLRTMEDVRERYKHTDEIKRTLKNLVTIGYTQLYRCRECGQFWQSGVADGGGFDIGYETLWQVTLVDPHEWRKQPYPNQIEQIEVQRFMDALPEESGPEACIEEACERLRIPGSVFCRSHHVAQLQRVGTLPDAPLAG